MIPANIKSLIDKYCMGMSPTDAQEDEIMDAAIAASLNADGRREVFSYMTKLINGPTREMRLAEEEAKRKAEADAAKRRAEEAAAKKKADEEAAARKRAAEEAKRKAEEEAALQAKRKVEEEFQRRSKEEEIGHKFTLPSLVKGAVPEIEPVNLGLSVNWAPCNLGAMAPEGYGFQFAWGEVEPKQEFTKDNYSGPHIAPKLTFAKDAATFYLKKGWRMPTISEFEELVAKCRWSISKRSGVSGYEAVGPNGKSIFFPCPISDISSDEQGLSIWCSDRKIPMVVLSIVPVFSATIGKTNSYKMSVQYEYRGSYIRPVRSSSLFSLFK